MNKNILIIDDDEITLTLIKNLLEAVRFNVTITTNGYKALKIVQEQQIDLILLDVYMPKINGFETCKLIKENIKNKDLPIIFLTVSNNEDDIKTAFSVGGIDYINKPIIKAELFSRINMHLRLYEFQYNLKEVVESQTSIIKQKSKELIEKLYHDENTNLRNLLALHKDIDKKNGNWIFLLDINDFNVVNKLYGFKFGDNLLKKVSILLKNILSEKVSIYKLPADRFAITVPNDEFSYKEICEKSEKILDYFDTNEIVIDNIITLKINFNIGVTKIKNIDTIIEAEYALDLSKKQGNRYYHIIENDSDFLDKEKDNLYWLFKTRRFIDEDMIVPFFQAIVDTKTQETYKYEALARVIDEDKVIPPYKFIDSAKKLGIITEVTKAMIKKSCKYFSSKDISFSINFTDRDLLDNNIIDFLIENAKRYNIKHENITLEILENITLLENNVFNNINKLKENGFKIAIDDFGSENSNFSRIIHLKADYIKIDGIFIKDMKENIDKQNITLSIIQLAKNLGMKSIAEFVSDKETYELLKEYGVDYIQGYYFAKPKKEVI